MPQTDTSLSREEIRGVLKKNYGSISTVAEKAGVARMSVSLWLKGNFKSARIERVATRVAVQLLKKESPNAV